MTPPRIRFVAVAVFAIAGIGSYQAFGPRGGSLVSNTIGVTSLVLASLALLAALAPRLLFPSVREHDQRGTEPDTAADFESSPGSHREPSSETSSRQRASLNPAFDDATQMLIAIGQSLKEIASDVAQLRRDTPSQIANLTKAVASVEASILRIQIPASVTRPQESRSAEHYDAVGREESRSGPARRDGSDEGIRSRLETLAAKCLARGLTLRDVREELPDQWDVSPLTSSDTPDAFLVRPSSRETWVVPNTRDWVPFRNRGWFQVQGPDAANARIKTLHRLPRLTSSGEVLAPGVIEVAVR